MRAIFRQKLRGFRRISVEFSSATRAQGLQDLRQGIFVALHDAWDLMAMFGAWIARLPRVLRRFARIWFGFFDEDRAVLRRISRTIGAPRTRADSKTCARLI